MSAPARPNFKPFQPAKNIDKLASAAKAYAQREGIPELVHPGSGEGEGSAAPALSAISPAVTPLKRLAVFLPDYLVDDIHERAFKGGCTSHYITADAFRRAGFHVDATDLIKDRRRGK